MSSLARIPAEVWQWIAIGVLCFVIAFLIKAYLVMDARLDRLDPDYRVMVAREWQDQQELERIEKAGG